MVTTFIGTYEDLVEISGTSAKGPYTFWQLVIKHETNQQYGDKLVAVDVWKSDLLQKVNEIAQSGQKLQLDCSVDAKLREKDGKKQYNVNIYCFRVSPYVVQQPMMQQAVMPQPMVQQAVMPQAYQQPIQMPNQQPYGANVPPMPYGQGFYGNGNNNPPY